MILIQQFTKLPVFRQLSQKELKKVKEENENELIVGDRKFIKQNTFKNFLKFRTKVLIGVSFVLLFVSYSMLNLNFVTNSWLKNNGIFTLFFCCLYIWLFWFYLKNLYFPQHFINNFTAVFCSVQMPDFSFRQFAFQQL